MTWVGGWGGYLKRRIGACLGVQRWSHLKASAFTRRVYGSSLHKSVADGIDRRHLDKYYFPLLKVAALLFPVFI